MDEREQTSRDLLADAVKATPKKSRKTPRIERLREIVSTHGAARVEGVLMDVTTASMLVKIHDALNETNREKFLAMPIRRMVSVGWSLVK